MAIKIPLDYDYKAIELDPIETIVRDDLNINIKNWAEFRHTITGSVNANHSLKSHSPISNDVKSSYIELSKSHYECVTMLGATKMSLIALNNSFNNDPLLFKKSFKEFYMHAGSVLDNLARLIYIVNIPNAVSALDRNKELKRHSLTYGSLETIYKNNKIKMNGYSNVVANKAINEIRNIRNNFTHSWPPTIFIDKITLEYLWPVAMRKRSQYYLWPYDPDEIRRIRIEYKKKIPLIEMVTNDWVALEKFQNKVFKKLTINIKKFEKNHQLKIV